MRTEAQRRTQSKYIRANKKQYNLTLSLKYDADVARELDNHPNKIGYIKALVRNDVANGRVISSSVVVPDPKERRFIHEDRGEDTRCN